jgi:lysophospholipase
VPAYAKSDEESMDQPLSNYAYLQTPQGMTLRYGSWSSPVYDSRGTILLLQGRSEFMEKYEETIGELLARGLDVVSFDWRGQGLSERLLAESDKGFVHSYDDYLTDLDHIVQSIVLRTQKGPFYLLSHSMGGHIGLRYLDQNPHPFAKAVFSAPMINVKTSPVPQSLVRWLTRLQSAKGNNHLEVAGASRSTPFPPRFKNNRLTSDRARFDRNRKMIRENPHLSAARVTYGWLNATYDSIDILKTRAIPKHLNTPLLFFCAGLDRIVSRKAILRFASLAPQSLLVQLDTSQHEILQERDTVRARFWDAFDSFIL